MLDRYGAGLEVDAAEAGIGDEGPEHAGHGDMRRSIPPDMSHHCRDSRLWAGLAAAERPPMPAPQKISMPTFANYYIVHRNGF